MRHWWCFPMQARCVRVAQWRWSGPKEFRMSKRRLVVPLAGMLVLHVGSVAQAWHTLGRVYCDANGDGLIDGSDLPLDGVNVRGANTSGTFSSSALTQNGGQLYIVLPDTPDSFKLNLDPATLPG